MTGGMPVAQAIKHGCEVSDNGGDDMTIDRCAIVRRAVDRYTLVQANAASDLYWTSPGTFDHGADYPPMRAPFETMWFEWTAPPFYRNASTWKPWPEESSRYWFALMQEAPADWLQREASKGDGFSNKSIGQEVLALVPPKVTASTMLITGGGFDRGAVHLLRGVLVANVGLDGNMAGLKFDAARFKGRHGIDPGSLSDSGIYDGVGVIGCETQDEASMLGCLKPAMLAIGLMNTRNVTLRESTLAVARSGREKRCGAPRLTYQTIMLPGHPSAGGGGRRPTQELLPMHKVRGHFKTFTAERPLLGKHTGTYWWGWQARGHKKNGEIVSDYALQAVPS